PTDTISRSTTSAVVTGAMRRWTSTLRWGSGLGADFFEPPRRKDAKNGGNAKEPRRPRTPRLREGSGATRRKAEGEVCGASGRRVIRKPANPNKTLAFSLTWISPHSRALAGAA